MDGYKKRGRYSNSHLHLNVTYLAMASPDKPLRAKPDKNCDARWMGFDETLAASTEHWMLDRIYRKLVGKVAGVSLWRYTRSAR